MEELGKCALFGRTPKALPSPRAAKRCRREKPFSPCPCIRSGKKPAVFLKTGGCLLLWQTPAPCSRKVLFWVQPGRNGFAFRQRIEFPRVICKFTHFFILSYPETAVNSQWRFFVFPPCFLELQSGVSPAPYKLAFRKSLLRLHPPPSLLPCLCLAAALPHLC